MLMRYYNNTFIINLIIKIIIIMIIMIMIIIIIAIVIKIFILIIIQFHSFDNNKTKQLHNQSKLHVVSTSHHEPVKLPTPYLPVKIKEKFFIELLDWMKLKTNRPVDWLSDP